jgi:hypothetical protein
MWIYYISTMSILDPIIVNFGREADGGSDVWQWGITNPNSFSVECYHKGSYGGFTPVTIGAGETYTFGESDCGNFTEEAYFAYVGGFSNIVEMFID